MQRYKAPVCKGVFPYEYLTRQTLYNPYLPRMKDFYSSLEGKNLLGDTLEEQRLNYILKVVKVWKVNDIQNLSQLLIHYNELDVQPFSVAVNRWLKNFHLYNSDSSVITKEGVDVLKTTIGILLVARQLMYNSAATYPGFKGFTLFDEKNMDWDERFRDNIVGGPSVIYAFHHKAGETRLRDPIRESCANQCWIWMQWHFMPAGCVNPCPTGQASGMTPVTHQRTLLTQGPGSSIAWPVKWTQGSA